MTDELGRELGAWLRTIDARPADPATSLRRSMANVERTPQVSRSRLAAVLDREPIPTEPIGDPSIHHHSGRIGQDRPVHVTTRGNSRVFITATAMAVTTAFVLAGSLLLSSTVEGPTNPPVGASPAPATESPSPLVGDETGADDLFELTLTTPRTTWSADEPIEFSATLTYIGEEPEVTVIGAGSGLVGFGVEQLDGPVDMEPGWRLSAREYDFAQGDGIDVPFTKSGGFDPEDPMAGFWGSWFDDPELRLPAGEYILSAVASYGLPDAANGLWTEIGAELPIEVVADATPPLGASPAPATESPSVMSDPQPVVATARDNGVRVSMAWEEPLTAGKPAYLRTTVTNTRDTPIWWLYGTSGLSVQAVMPGLERRVGEPVVPLDFGDPDTLVIDLKNNLTDFGKHLRTRLALPLELDEVQGLRRPGGGDVGLPPERVRPGGTLEFVHRWDGSLEFEQDQPGDVGLPPSGPVEVTGAASYALEPDGKVRSTEVRLETSVVGGWDEQHLDPLEVVDAVMADPGSAALLADADFSRYDTGIILFDTDEGVWYVGSCGRMSTDDPVHWRLAQVDPVSGEVLGLIDGLGTKSCDAGTWPGAE